MKKQFEAYYSEKWALFWLVLSVFFAAGIVLFAFLWLSIISLIFMIALFICFLAFLFMFIRTKNQKGIAIEVIDDILILHKKETISIPLNEIQRINIHDADGSFDIIVKTADRKISLHCFIENQRKKKTMLIEYLKSKNVNISTYNLI